MQETLDFLTQYGGLVLFGVVFAEQIGFPIPAVPVLVAAGVLAETGHMNLWTAVGVTVAAALLADGIWYELGRRHGRKILNLLCRIALEPDSCVRRTEVFFAGHGPVSLIISKFIPGLSTIAPPLAGIVGLTLPWFLLYDGLGVLIWSGGSIGIGYIFGDQIEYAIGYTDHVAPAIGLLLAGLLLYVVSKALYRRHQLRRVPRITVEELSEKLGTENPPVLIDLRGRPEVESDPGIPGALYLSLDELAHQPLLSPERETVLYCGCPDDVTSAQGALLLRRHGFTRVRPLAGGVQAWHDHRAVSVPRPIAALSAIAVGIHAKS
ncbi:MAG TPA: VTT domain-containing protein [Nitrospira sp.]|nr:VTT domain-containing protein [Nitrospira sp.]